MNNKDFSNIVLSKEDFANCEWKKVIEQSSIKTCEEYSNGFKKKINGAKERQNIKSEIVLTLLNNITYYTLSCNGSYPENFEVLESIIIEKEGKKRRFTNQHLEALYDWAKDKDLSDPELKARIADIFWKRDNNVEDAKTAIECYLKSFNSLLEFESLLEEKDNKNFAIRRINRAIYLAFKINHEESQRQLFDNVKNILDNYLDNKKNIHFKSFYQLMLLFLPPNQTPKMSKLLEETKRLKYANFTEKKALELEIEKNWDDARSCWQMAIQWHHINKKNQEELSAKHYYAESFVKEAEQEMNELDDGNILVKNIKAQHCIKQAINELKKLNNTKDRRKELHKILVSIQENSMSSMPKIETKWLIPKSLNIKTTCIPKILNFFGIRCKEKIKKSLQNFASKRGDISLLELVQEEVDGGDGNINLREYFPTVPLDKTGKVTGNSSSENQKYYVANQIRTELSIHIEQSRCEIKKYCVKISDLDSIVLDNNFIPQERVKIYARGLYAGLNGDFLIAAHLLIPQIENSLRYILQKHEKITSWLDDKGVQDNYIFSTLIKNYKQDLEFILGEDITFDLIGLLNCKDFGGGNLRNLMAHGLIDSDDFNNGLVIYFWWFTLYLCYYFKTRD